MRNGDKLHFSPKFRFQELQDWKDPKTTIEALEDRIQHFFIKPAQQLNRARLAFAAGVLEVTAIDSLARLAYNIEQVGLRFKRWVTDNLLPALGSIPPAWATILPDGLYNDFRNGLVHEGRVKNAGQFTYDYTKTVDVIGGQILVVNPDFLLACLMSFTARFMQDLQQDPKTFSQVQTILRADFGQDVAAALALK